MKNYTGTVFSFRPINIVKIFVVISAVIYSLTFMTSANEVYSADIRYKNVKPIPSIVENNATKMSRAKNLKSISPNEVIYYVCDPITNEANVKSTLNEIKTLSNSLVKGASSEYAKIKVLADYVGNNIAYDMDAAHNYVGFDEICLRNVLDRKRSTCAGFANLFSSLCNAQGIYCVNVRGAAPGDGISWSNLDDPSAPRNHEWTAVWYKTESRWLYVDCTWNSTSRFQNGSFINGKRTDTFFDLDEARFAIEHKAMLVDYRDFQSALSLFTTPATKPVSASTSGKVVSGTNKTDKNTITSAPVSENAVSGLTDSVSEPDLTETSTDVSVTDSMSSDGNTRFIGNSTDPESDKEQSESGGLSGFQKGAITVVGILVLGGGVTFAVLRKKGL
ncbi:MAG: hypothetical protein LBL93_07695 [Ruminococcus sp.]|jgi:hypothetical protein|nr:hypothetical protein [Ruminococcus sp.]